MYKVAWGVYRRQGSIPGKGYRKVHAVLTTRVVGIPGTILLLGKVCFARLWLLGREVIWTWRGVGRNW